MSNIQTLSQTGDTPPPGDIVNMSPYIVGETNSDFTDIQPAIDAAVLAGYNSSNPVNIYVKPSNATYVNAITGADGINIVGLGYCFNSATGLLESNSVRVYAPYTHPDNATCTIQGISFNGQNVEQQGGTLYLENCTFPASATILYTGETTKSTVLNNCYASGVGSFFSDDTQAQLVNITINNCASDKVSASVFSTAVTANIIIDGYTFSDQITIQGDSCSLNVSNCQDTKLTGRQYPFNMNAATNGTFTARNFSTINGLGDFSGCTMVTVVNCKGDWINTNIPDGCQFGIGSVTNVVNGGGSFFDTFIEVSSRIGFKASNPESGQAYISTTDDTETTILQVEMLDNTSITLTGRINASSSTHLDACGGDFLIVANRPPAGPGVIVSTADINVKSTTTATFDVSIDNSSPAISYITVTVTGLIATDYNWALSYEKIRMIDQN